MASDEARQVEFNKYTRAYAGTGYGMGPGRKTRAIEAVDGYQAEGLTTLLDVGCGRGELIDYAFSKGWDAHGLEVVDKLVDAHPRVSKMQGIHDLGVSEASDLVTCLDVLEHIIEDDVVTGISQMWKAAGKVLLLSIAHFRHDPYHITLKDPSWWINRVGIVVGTEGVIKEITPEKPKTTWLEVRRS